MEVTEGMRKSQKVGAIVSYLLASDSSFAETLFPEGVPETLVVAEGSDSVARVTGLVRQAGGDATVVAVRMDETGASFTRCRVTVSEQDHGAGHDVPVGPECTIIDLVKILSPGASISITCVDGYALGLGEVDRKRLDGDLAGV